MRESDSVAFIDQLLKFATELHLRSLYANLLDPSEPLPEGVSEAIELRCIYLWLLAYLNHHPLFDILVFKHRIQQDVDFGSIAHSYQRGESQHIV